MSQHPSRLSATNLHRFARFLAVLLFALLAVRSTADQGSVVRHFNVPRGDAVETLKRAALQGEAEILFLADTVKGVRTNAVRGQYTITAALGLMLAGTSLSPVQDETSGAISIARRSLPPLSVATTPRSSGAKAPAQGSEREVVKLPAFSVSANADVGYVGKEALSTTRTGIALLDLAQSVKVLNREFIDDINPSNLIDSLKYVGGGQAGNINFADDRFTLRGFNSPANAVDFVDGFRATTDSNTDLAVIERLEIIKGPSAIFVANGPVGGVINKITKSPVSYDIRTLRLQAGRFDANRAELDLGGRLTSDSRWLYRLVLAGQRSDGWYDHTYAHRMVFAPSLAYDFGGGDRLTFKYFYFNYRFGSYNGLPWDERTGRVIDIRRNATLGEEAPRNWRKDVVHRLMVEYTKHFNDHLALRLAVFNGWNNASRVESVNGISLPPNFVNGTRLNRNTTAQDNVHRRRQVQADLVANFATGPVLHQVLTGADLYDGPSTATSFAGSSSSIDPFRVIFPGSVTVQSDPSSRLRTNNRQQKYFVLETARLLENRLLLTFGASRIHAETSSINPLNGTTTPRLSLQQNLRQYSAVVKLTPGCSLFYGFNENFAPNFLNGLVLSSQLGQQRELGLKGELYGGRLSFTLAHFDIRQANIPVPAFPQTTPPTFLLVPGQTSRGFDGDLTFALTKNLDLLASFATFNAVASSQADSTAPVIKNPVNNVAEHTFGLWTRYRFTEGSLKGLALGVGISHLSSRAGANNSNALVYGHLKPFTLADIAITYDHGRFRYGLNIDNLLGRDYDAAVRNQSIVIPGMARNVKASVTWSF